MKAKFITIILVLIMAMSMMTACGSSGASEKVKDTTVETEMTTEETVSQETEQSVSVNESSDIGAEKAKQIILDKVPGAVEASIYEFERDYDDGRVVYEGSLYHDGYEYEFEVDGATGSLLQWEIDD